MSGAREVGEIDSLCEPSREDYRQVWWRNHEGLRCSTFVRRDDPNADAAIEARSDFKEWWS